MPEVTRPKFAVIIHNVRSVYNVGSIFRTADGAGADMVYLSGYTPGPDNHPERINKTALGAEKCLSWERVAKVGDLIKRLRKSGVTVVALEQYPQSSDYRSFKPKFPLAIVVGNEVSGIKPMSHNVFDAAIEIPMRGSKESLNVSVAFGIAAYEITRRSDNHRVKLMNKTGRKMAK